MDVFICLVVLVVHFLLAAGVGGSGAVSDSVAGAIALPAGWDRGRGGAPAGVGVDHASGAGDPDAIFQSAGAALSDLTAVMAN